MIRELSKKDRNSNDKFILLNWAKYFILQTLFLQIQYVIHT